MKKKVTAPLSYDPGNGRPKEHLAYLNWQEMQQLRRLNGDNMERGPRGLPSFPPADAIGSSSRATSSKTSGSRGPGGGSLSAPSRTAPSSGRGFQDSRGGGGGRDSGARGNVGMGKAPSGSKTPGYGGGGRDAGRAAPKPSSLGKATSGVGRGISKEEAARIVSRLDEMSKRLEREQKAIFANRPDYLARGKIQDRVISAAEGQPYRMSTPTVYTSAPPRVTPAPTFSVNAMTTDLGRLQRGMRDRISQEAFIQAGYMPGFKSLGDIERDRKISAAVGQPYGMKTPISPARGQPYGVKSPISPARGQPYGMNLPPSNVPSTEISAKTIPVKKDISDISKLTDEYSLASGMSFRGFPTIGAGQVEQRPTLAGTSSVIPRTPEDHMTSVLGTSYAQRWYPGEQMFRTPQEISRDIAGYSSAGIDALGRSKIYSDRIPSDSSAPVSPSAQVPNANVTVLQKAREPLRPFYAGASEGLPPGYSDRYLNKQADTSGETVLQVEDVPIESEFATKEEVKEAAKKAGFRPSVYESEDFLSDPNRLGMMAESPEDISPTDMAKLVSRAYGENYLTRSEKDRLAASRIAQAAMKLNPLARLAVFGAEKVIKPENVKAFLARPSYEQEELYRLGREMDERYGRREPGQTASLTQYAQDSGGQYGGPDLGRGDRGGGIGGLPDRGRGPSSGTGQTAPPATQASGRPYIYYQWDVGVNIPSPGDPDYTNYQEYLRRRAQAQA